MHIQNIVLIVAIILIAPSIIGIRKNTRYGNIVTIQTVNTTMLWCITTLCVLIFKFSFIHLLWLFPLGFLIGTFSITFPFLLISPLGRLFGQLCCFGISKDEIMHNYVKMEMYKNLIQQGMTPEEAFEIVKDFKRNSEAQ